MVLKEEMPQTILAIWGQNILSEGWTTIPNVLMKSQSKLNISNSELVLLLHLISFIHSPFAKIYPSIKLLSDRMNQDRRTIQRTMRKLEDKQLVRKRIRSESKHDVGLTNTYDVDPLMRQLIAIQLSKK
ncbi:helix-turn-helix domain-containing protein [Escherichia coli]|uniref:helix-turn-helix domain-containing protein n=1 Tax=Escherichia coli TaxID=562 RepID=UPI0035C1826C